MDVLYGILNSILSIAYATWWIFVPVILLFPLRELWVIYLQDKEIKRIGWILLEIKVPKDVLKTPKAMEQIFAAVYADFTHGLSFVQRYYLGTVDSWYSFEIVGSAANIHFYVFLSSKLRNNMESAIYSQYPDAEIHEVEDYTELLPRTLPNDEFDLWGTDLILARESAYPIRVYHYFEEAQEEKRLDPISALTEVMSDLKEGEWIWWQVIVSPTSNDRRIRNNWKEEGEEIIAKIEGREKTPTGLGWLGAFVEWIGKLVLAPFEHPVWSGADKKETQTRIKFLNPAETEVVKAIDSKISKLGLDTRIRFIYIGRKDVYDPAYASAIMGTVRQFNTQNLNNIRPGKELTLVTGWKAEFLPFYKKLKLFSQRKKLFSNYKARRLRTKMVGKFRPDVGKLTTFSTEELATIYHFPTLMVGTPKIQRIESKKGSPPPNLPIEK